MFPGWPAWAIAVVVVTVAVCVAGAVLSVRGAIREGGRRSRGRSS